MSSDPIADMLTIIRNGGAARKKVVECPNSKVKLEILKILKDEGFIIDYQSVDRIIKIELKYFDNKFAIVGIKRISKPGVRIYNKSKNLKRILSGYGVTIVTNSKGVMTDEKARAKKLGGEVLCQVW